MADDSALDELPIGTLVVVGALLLAALTLPTFAPGPAPEETNASNGTIVTPDGTQLEEVDNDRGPLDGLNMLPSSHLEEESPTIQASAGAQTMRVESTTVDGEPALNLSDDRIHEGRWVSVPTEWFKETHGEVPSVAKIAHEESGTYTEPIQVRGNSAAFYVRGFSTNTVSFGGELVIDDRPATDGTRHTYVLDPTDSVTNVSVNLTGVENTAEGSVSATLTNGQSLTANVGGTTVRSESVTFTGKEETAQASLSPGIVSPGYSTTIDVGGNVAPRDETVTITGDTTRSSFSGSGSGDGSVSVGGNQPAESISATLEGSTAQISNGDTSGSSAGTYSISNGNLDPSGPASGEPRATVTWSGAFGEKAETGNAYEKSRSGYESGAVINPNYDLSKLRVTMGPRAVDGTGDARSADLTVRSGGTVIDTIQGLSPGNVDGRTFTFDGNFNAGTNYKVLIQPNGGEFYSNYYNFDGTDYPYSSEQLDIVDGWYGNTGGTIVRGIKSIEGKRDNVDVSVSANDGTTTEITTISDGETKSSGIDLSADASSITLSGPSAGSLSWSLTKTDRTGTEDPALDLDSDGSAEVSHSGVLSPGSTVTLSASDGDLTPGSNSIDASTAAGPLPSWMIDGTKVTATEDPSVSVGGVSVSYSGVLSDGQTYSEPIDISTGTRSVDLSGTGQAGLSVSWSEVTGTKDPSVSVDGSTVSHGGVLSPGETVSDSLTLSTGSNTLDVSTGGEVGVSVSWTEVSKTRAPRVEINNESVGVSGTLADGETVSLSANSSWIREGTNNVSIQVGDDSYSGVGPEPKVGVEYRHDLESPRSVSYESEAFSERYNVSKTYTTKRADATLTIPHSRTVVSMRSVEYQLNESGSWTSVPQMSYNLNGTRLVVDVSDLAGETVPSGTTIEVRSVGSRIKSANSDVSVLEATPVGFDLDSRVRLDSWSTESYIALGETPQSGLVTYGVNESWPTESDYAELYADGRQRYYAPNATAGSELTLNTLPARVAPENNNMRVRVPESANATDTEFVVEPASVVGDAWTAEYVAGVDGEWYAVVDNSGEELGVAQKPSPIEVSRDDVGLVSIEPSDEPTAADSGTVGGGVFATVTTGNLPSLLVLFGSVGLLFVAGAAPARSRDAVDEVASSARSALSNIPRVGEPVGSAVEGALSGVGNAAVSLGANRLLTGAIGAAVALAAAEAGLFTIGSEAGAILAVAGIAIASLFLLREADEFTTARWIAIVGVAGVVGLQGLGEGDLLAQFVDSDAFLIAVLIAGYAAIQLVREYRQNNGPDDDRPQIVFRSDGGAGDDEGSS